MNGSETSKSYILKTLRYEKKVLQVNMGLLQYKFLTSIYNNSVSYRRIYHFEIEKLVKRTVIINIQAIYHFSNPSGGEQLRSEF